MSKGQTQKPKPGESEDGVLLRSSTQFAEPAETFSADMVKPNVAIGLDTAACWRLPSGKIELNSFTGIISAPIPDGLTQDEKEVVATALNYRRIKVVDKIEKAEPATYQEDLLSPRMIQARRITDEKDPAKFKEWVSKQFKADVLEACIAAEQEGLNRKEYITILMSKLSALRG